MYSMYVCMYVCMHVCMYVCIYTDLYANTYLRDSIYLIETKPWIHHQELSINNILGYAVCMLYIFILYINGLIIHVVCTYSMLKKLFKYKGE
jgi:hypothetical protein